MNSNQGLPLVAPRVTPVLDPWFRPAVLANRAFRREVDACSSHVPVRLAIEQGPAGVYHLQTRVFPDNHPRASGNFTFLERIVKSLLWSRGGFRIYLDGPVALAERLAAHYGDSATGKFDSDPRQAGMTLNWNLS